MSSDWAGHKLVLQREAGSPGSGFPELAERFLDRDGSPSQLTSASNV